jgi:hypothetical protein
MYCINTVYPVVMTTEIEVPKLLLLLKLQQINKNVSVYLWICVTQGCAVYEEFYEIFM